MPFKRYVEIGRLALINFGDEYGKLVVITDVVDENRALVDRPDELRRVINFKRLSITDFKIDIPRLAKKKVLKKVLEESDVFNKFAQTTWGKRIAQRERKANLTDFERYQDSVKRRARNAQIRKLVEELS